MRAHSSRLFRAGVALAGLFAALSLAPLRTGAAEDTNLSGTWKIIELRFVDLERLSFDVKDVDGRLVATVAEPAQLREIVVTKFERKGDQIVVELKINNNSLAFRGTAASGQKFLGTFSVASQVSPARLVKTDDKILAQPVPPAELFKELSAIEQLKSPKEKADKFAEILHKAPGDPKFSVLYGELVRYAALAEEPADQVRKYAKEWMDGAEPYGAEWSLNVRTQVLKVLSDKKPYAELALELAEQTEKLLGDDAPLEVRADVVTALASAAKLAGKPEIVARAEAQATKIESELDEDYHKKVPPFKPEVSEGRADKAGDRVVLVELFTGAQCPPCVAADVAFDALNLTYKPSEVITLQYHLHIPGPDPLTNPSSLARQEYFSVGSTPSAYFNGKAQPPGGGYMPQSKAKYDEYRKVIKNILNTKKRALIDLHVERSGDEIKISASAKTKAGGAKHDEDDGKAKPKGGGSAADKDGIKLRLVVAEEQIRYVGGNKLRFHHHVVCAMPGGPAGKALADGEGKVEVTLKLADLRKELDSYLDEFTKEKTGFPSARPPIALTNLAVVAFVQDDSDKSILDAVSVPVAEAKGEPKAGE